MKRQRTPLAVAAVLVIAVAAGCGGGSDDNSGAAAPATGAQPAPSGPAPSGGASGGAATADMVNIHNFAFAPASTTVKSGAAVTWTFEDAIQHTVVADDNSFSSKPMGNGQTFSHTFAAAGSVPYHCSIHPFMKGTVTVQ